MNSSGSLMPSISSPENVHLRPYAVLHDRNILGVIVGFVDCLLNGDLIKRDDSGPTYQFVASVCQKDERDISRSLLVLDKIPEGSSNPLTNRKTQMRQGPSSLW